MLRHLKMEFKRQEALAASKGQHQQQHSIKFNGLDQQQVTNKLINLKNTQEDQTTPRPKRVRGRRSSKPQMEKRRRARINQCLDILKNYVLTDSTNLSCLGIEANKSSLSATATLSGDENEESIARQILKSSGLINRHRGRKNPNKLEKADILELTVDYVRRLHEQREKLMSQHQQLPELQQHPSPSIIQTGYLAPPPSRASSYTCTSPLSLNLPPTGAHQLPSPPPSSASSSPQPLLSVCCNNAHVLDLSQNTNKLQVRSQQRTMIQNGQLMMEGSDGCWRPWTGYQQMM